MKNYLCAIDTGSTLCRVIVARYHPSDSSVEILGMGVSVSRGVKNGSVINIDLTAQAVSEAAREAELMSGLMIEDVCVNVTGKTLIGDNSRGVVAITNRDRQIHEADVLRVIEGAQNIRMPADQEILHVLSRQFRVDDQDHVRSPVGMIGVRLEAEVHIVTASSSVLSNIQRAVSGASFQIGDGVMNSLAAAEAVLSNAEKELGVAVVDIGGGVADIILYLDGGVYFSTILPLGGIHVTQDISIGLKVPLDVAERVKKSTGTALVSLVDPTEKIELPGLHGRPPRWTLRRDVAGIIEPRMREIFELIDMELIRSGKKAALSGGVVLTGGASLLEGACELAEEVFSLPVTLGYPYGVTGLAERVNSPEFSTVIGLIRYAGKNRDEQDDLSSDKKERRQMTGGKEVGVFRKIKSWIDENL